MKRTTWDAGRDKGRRKRLVLTAYALWVVLILIASVPYLAETGTRKFVSDGEYEYHPRFDFDGNIDHYKVERADPDQDASIDLEYHMHERSVDIDARNIKTLSVDCRSIATEKHQELLDTNYADDHLFHQYFYDMGYLIVDTVTSDDMEITWKYMPVPAAVVADGRPYDGDWVRNGGNIVVDVPSGTHSYILYFEGAPEFPTAVASVDHPAILVGKQVEFDGSGSVGGEGFQGAIEDYLWNFGEIADDTTPDKSGKTATHTYDKAGTYTATLTVRNGYGLMDTATVEVKVRKSDPSIDKDDDGEPDWEDDDIDGDGFSNADEERLGTKDDDPDSTPLDTDGDYIADSEDEDLDGDGVNNDIDDYPMDGTKWSEPEKASEGSDMSLAVALVAIITVVIVIVLILVMRKKKKQSELEAEEARAAAAAAATPVPGRKPAPFVPPKPAQPPAAATPATVTPVTVEARPVTPAPAKAPTITVPSKPAAVAGAGSAGLLGGAAAVEEAEEVEEEDEGDDALSAETPVFVSSLYDKKEPASAEADEDALEAELEKELEEELSASGGGLFDLSALDKPAPGPPVKKLSMKQPVGVSVKKPVSINGKAATMPTIRKPNGLKLKLGASSGVSKPPSLGGDEDEGGAHLSAREMYLRRKKHLNGSDDLQVPGKRWE